MEADTFGGIQEKISQAQSELERLVWGTWHHCCHRRYMQHACLPQHKTSCTQGVFKSVAFSLKPSPDIDGEVDVTVEVEERNRFELKTEVATGTQEAIMVCEQKERGARVLVSGCRLDGWLAGRNGLSGE
jgi:hypothetical protein